MAVSRMQIVPHERDRGRPSNDDLEARSATGRALHQLESRVFGIALACLRGRETRPVWASHDTLTDESVRANEVIGRELLKHDDPVVRAWGLRVLGNCADYRRADQMEDACTVGLFATLAEIHATAKRIGAWIERSCVAVRQRL